MQIEKYAPVLIPTLNRYEHFKRCLESLEQCTGAEKTEVYVGLDYPPTEKYRKGWEKIDLYLKTKEKDNGFKKLYVRRREHNCGVGKEGSNSSLLRKEIVDFYDFYINTEDDNVFSPNFLEYMNKCLWRFRDDNRIIKVCGYNCKVDFPEMYRNNFYLSKVGSAWGTGSWFKKQKIMLKYYDLNYLRNLIRDDNTYYLIMRRNKECIYYILRMLKKKQIHGDGIWEIYCALEDKYIILPTKSKTRNYGVDGTGVHSLKLDEDMNRFYSTQEIDTDSTFDFTDDIFTYPLYINDRSFKEKITIKLLYKRFVLKIDTLLLRKFNYLPTSKFI